MLSPLAWARTFAVYSPTSFRGGATPPGPPPRPLCSKRSVLSVAVLWKYLLRGREDTRSRLRRIARYKGQRRHKVQDYLTFANRPASSLMPVLKSFGQENLCGGRASGQTTKNRTCRFAGQAAAVKKNCMEVSVRPAVFGTRWMKDYLRFLVPKIFDR